jgi:hypothetical protein
MMRVGAVGKRVLCGFPRSGGRDLCVHSSGNRCLIDRGRHVQFASKHKQELTLKVACRMLIARAKSFNHVGRSVGLRLRNSVEDLRYESFVPLITETCRSQLNFV